LPGIAVNTIILRTTQPRIIFIGTDLGVYQSTDDGGSWASFNNGLPTLSVFDLKYKEPLGIIIAATHGRGCWTYNLPAAIGIKHISSDVPDKFKLFQNYPNPFNPTTNIKYQITNTSFVTLKVYDILGREAATLVNEKLQPGSYEVSFDGSNFSSGIYFYKLQAGNFTETRKMLMVK